MFSLTRKKSNRVKNVWSGAMADHVIALGWNADGHYLAAASSTGPMTIFDAKAGSGDIALAGHGGGTLALGWSPKADVLATAGKDGRVRLWNATGRPMATLEMASLWAEHLVWKPDGSQFAASSGRTVHVWDAAGNHLADLTDHPSTVSDLAWKPNSNTLASLVYGGVMLWTLHPDKAPGFKLFPWKGSPLKMAWSPNASMLAHGNQDSTVHFWYAETAEELQMWGYPRKIRELSWNVSSRYLATGGGPAVCIWDCGSGGPQGTKPQMLEGHDEESSLTAVLFQHHGHLLASASTDGRVCVWQPQNAKQPLVGEVEGDGSEATSLAWSRDDRLLAVGYESGAISVLAVS